MKRRAFTLTELLIVILVMVIVAVIALPLAKVMLEGNRTREASRQLQSYFAMAQTRAAQTGRPCGVHFVCVEALGQPGIYQATQCYLAEVPPPYVGATLSSRGKIYDPTFTGSGIRYFEMGQYNETTGAMNVDPNDVAILNTMVEEGESFFVRFDHKGQWFRCRRGKTSDPLIPDPQRYYYIAPATTDPVVPPGWGDMDLPNGKKFRTAGKSFAVMVSPRRSGSPLEMTDGSCVDLAYSGIGTNGRGFSAATRSLTVMFNPGGGLNSIWINAQEPSDLLTGSAHFLVGRVEKLTLPSGGDWDKPDLSNIADPTAIWVSVGRNGHVTTAENLPTNAAAQLGVGNLVEAGRVAAISRAQMSGR